MELHNRSRWLPLLLTFGPVVALLGAAVALKSVADVGVGDLTRDRAELVGGAFYAGAYSTLGLLLWGATASVCLFTATLLDPGRRETRRLFMLVAALSVLLLLDDMLLMHDVVFPDHLGVREEVVIGMHAVATLALVLAYRRIIVQARVAYLLAAFACFAGSLAVDLLLPGLERGHYLLEDGLKMLGIAGWCSFWVQRCALAARERVRGPSSL